MTGDPLNLAQIAFAALGDMSLVCALGALLLDGWLCHERAFLASSPSQRAWRRASRATFLAAILLAFCHFVSLWLQAAAMSGSPIAEAGASLWLVGTATHAGIGWSVALAGSVLLASAAARGPMTSSRMMFALVGALIAAAGKSAIGHAADAGAFSFAEAVQTVHLLATGVWGGLVIAGALAVLPALDAPLARASLLRIVSGMSRAATIAIGFVIATGVYNAWRGIGGSASVLTTSTWGHALVVKIVLVMGALAIGSINRWRAMPKLQRSGSTADAHAVIALMRLEAVSMAGVFVAASVLSHSVPGMAMMG
ncbi:Copper resistance protein D [Candidatus Burkholderia verschuerenii]|uniref:Copper resistance protein D n=1 Tax=Candidatus Burkholderia verschuerenii TaxID=242163 RepID=A0A0L0MHM1_9BURK|nr:CopD family protein [Candidatus Burkholderia verschuerenii]KND62172.1 Copper resistance protein D [Candidatus Burkholderia verschuerenii]